MTVLTAIESLFNRINLSVIIKPAIGAAAAGAIGLLLYELTVWIPEENTANLSRDSVLTILGHGYGAVQDALLAPSEMSPVVNGARWLTSLLIAVGKILSSAFTISSGGAAGTFGPSMVIAGCTGGAVGIALSGPQIAPSPAACVIIAMAGFLPQPIAHPSPVY